MLNLVSLVEDHTMHDNVLNGTDRLFLKGWGVGCFLKFILD